MEFLVHAAPRVPVLTGQVLLPVGMAISNGASSKYPAARKLLPARPLGVAQPHSTSTSAA